MPPPADAKLVPEFPSPLGSGSQSEISELKE